MRGCASMRAVFVGAHGERIVGAQRFRESVRRPHAPRNRTGPYASCRSRIQRVRRRAKPYQRPRAPRARRRRDRAEANAALPRPPRRAPDGNACACARAASRSSAGASSLRCTRWIVAEPGEVGEAARVVERASSVTSATSNASAQAAQQFGDAPRAAVPRRKHRERRDDQQTRPRWPVVVGGAQAIAVRRRTQRDGFAVRSGEPGRWQGLRRTRARQPPAKHARRLAEARELALARVRQLADARHHPRTREAADAVARSEEPAGCARRCGRSPRRNRSGRSSSGAGARRATAGRRGRAGRRARRARSTRHPPSRTDRSSGSSRT